MLLAIVLTVIVIVSIFLVRCVCICGRKQNGEADQNNDRSDEEINETRPLLES